MVDAYQIKDQKGLYFLNPTDASLQTRASISIIQILA